MDPHIWHGALSTPPNSRAPSSSSSPSSPFSPSTSKTPQPSGVSRTYFIPKSLSVKSSVPKSPSSLQRRTSTPKTPSTTAFQQKPPTRSPSSNHHPPPLRHQVNSTMEDPSLLRRKCDTYRTNLSLAKVTKEKLEGKLAAAKTTIADQNKNIGTLKTQLSRAQEELDSEKSRAAALAALEKHVQASTCDALRAQVDSKTYQARVYKIALKAALKLPGVSSHATYRSLLETTEAQMRKTHEEKLADKEAMERLACAQGEEEPRRDYCLAESALPRNDAVCGLASERRHGEVAAEEPQTPGTKRGAESDSDGAPVAKMRRLTPRQSPRRIIHDD